MPFNVGSIASLCGEFQKSAADEGASNRPDSKSVAPDLNEVKAITMAKQAVASEEATVADSLVQMDKQSSEIAQRVAALDAECLSHSSHDFVDSAFRAVLAQRDHALVAACADEMKTRAAMNGFRFRNGIKDPASYPPDRLFHFSLLILFVCIETGVNAFFYEGSTGLLGGAFIALSVSVVNMGIAALLGALFRYVNLPGMKNKIIGYASLFGFIIAGFVMNLIFSTFRVQYQLLQIQVLDSNLSEPSTTQLVAALRVAVTDAFSVFGLNFPTIDFMSFVLFFVGFGCSVIAFWKGYTFDDKFPGHGEYDRLHKEKEATFVKIKDGIFHEAVASVTQTAQEVEALRTRILSEQHHAATLKAHVSAAKTSFISSVKTIQSELSLALDTYRAANRATRTTTAPGYFGDTVNVIPGSVGEDRLAPLLEKIAAASAEAKVLADTHGRVLGERLIRIQQQTNALVENEFLKHLGAVKLRAEALISAQQGGIGQA
jgi:hypothetical protein